MPLENLMRDLAAELGLGDIRLEEDGGAQLAFGDDIQIDISASGEWPGINITALVGAIPTDNREAVYSEMLEANYQGLATGGAALCIDTVLGEVILSRHIAGENTDFEVFAVEVSRFFAALTMWRERLQKGQIGSGDFEFNEDDDHATAADEDPAPEPPGSGMISV
ncbi:MAG: type III secretion system chaperone [Pseudomonadota bacterium]